MEALSDYECKAHTDKSEHTNDELTLATGAQASSGGGGVSV